MDFIPFSIGGAVLAYIGGVFTKPLQDHIAFLRRKHELRVCLYSEVGRLISQHHDWMNADGVFKMMRIRSTNDAFKLAMQSPEVFYSLKEKYFFDGLYRVLLDYEGRRKTPASVRTVMAAIVEQIMLGKVDRKFLRKHCDEDGQRHIDLLPKRVFKSVRDYDEFVEQVNARVA